MRGRAEFCRGMCLSGVIVFVSLYKTGHIYEALASPLRLCLWQQAMPTISRSLSHVRIIAGKGIRYGVSYGH